MGIQSRNRILTARFAVGGGSLAFFIRKIRGVFPEARRHAERAMFETAIAVIGAALLLTLSAGAGSLLLHHKFGAEIPPGVQPLDNLFKSILATGAGVLLAP